MSNVILATRLSENSDYSAFRRHACAANPSIFEFIVYSDQWQLKTRKQDIAIARLKLILEATFKLSASSGFQAMTLRQLAQATDMSLGGLYAYITSKAALADMIQHGLKQYCMEFYVSPGPGHAHSEDDLKTFIFTHLYLSEWLQPWFYFSYMECKHLQQPQKQYAKTVELETESILASIIDSGQIAGTFRDLDSRLAAGMIKSLLQDWYLKRWKFRSRKIPVDRYAVDVLNMALRYL